MDASGARLPAAQSHVEEQMAVLWEKHNSFVDKREMMDKRLQEAKSLGREVAAQHIQAEVRATSCQRIHFFTTNSFIHFFIPSFIQLIAGLFVCLFLGSQISVNIAELQENQAKIKDLQRENYFIGLERKRKLGVMQKLKNEIAEAKRKAQLQKKIEQMIKKHVRIRNRNICL